MKMLGQINFENKICVPENLFLVQKKAVLHDDLPVIWYRFAKSQSTQLGGEHFSFTYDENNKKLMGFMHMDKMYTEDVLPNEQEAQEIADAFLSQYAPDLKKSVEVRWIKPQRVNPIDPPHDEGFPLHNAGTVVGMRVKMWDTLTKKYAWVIVGKNKDIISFERDIIWNSLLHKRQTAQWLHDAWLKKNKVSLEPDGIIC